jgi:hypothetical protein
MPSRRRVLLAAGLTRLLANPAPRRHALLEQVAGDRITGGPRRLLQLLVARDGSSGCPRSPASSVTSTGFGGITQASVTSAAR